MSRKLSIAAAVSSVVASMIGAGIFALPGGVAMSGLIAGLGVSLVLGWFLFTIPALALAKACDLCEELDDLEEELKPENFGENKKSRRELLQEAKTVLLPAEEESKYQERRGSRLSASRVSQGSAGGEEGAAATSASRRQSRTYLGSKPVVDGFNQPELRERVSVVVGSHIDANGRESVTIVEEDKKIYLLGDVAERAFSFEGSKIRWGKVARYAVNILGSLYLLFACAIFLLLMGDAVANLLQNVALMRGDRSEYLAGSKEAVWAEAVVFALLMACLVQIPDVSIIARVSFIGTGAAIGICLVFVIAPLILHTEHGLPNPAPGQSLATWYPVKDAKMNLEALQNTEEEKFYLWAKDSRYSSVEGSKGPVVYQLQDYAGNALGSAERVLESLAACAFGFAFALLVPYVRADLEEPKRMGQVILIATILTALVYAMVVFAGLLAGGQRYLLVANSNISKALKWFETEVRWSKQGEAGSLDPQPPTDAVKITEISGVEIGGEKYNFYLTKNEKYFLGEGSNIGKGTLLSFIMMIFLAVKLVISYPLTVWPTIRDAEIAVQSTCGKRKAGSKPQKNSKKQDAKDSDEEAEHVAVEERPMDEYEELPFLTKALVRVAVVAFTFGIAAIFGCQESKLGAVMGLAAAVPGVLSMVMFPMIAIQLLQRKRRQLTQQPATGKEIGEMVFHAFLMIIAISVLVYQLKSTPKQIADAFKGDEEPLV
ncbi:unnamed protein product [Amoebophrya sp. A120]|nr:unnamed protein product [Amoebophrya sp. A120]|eukprot:GSA120T00006537001.1